MTTDHVIRMIFFVVSFGFAMIVATTLSISRGSPLFGRILLVLFSFAVMLGQVARYNEPLKWNAWFTAATLALCLVYAYEMIKELRRR